MNVNDRVMMVDETRMPTPYPVVGTIMHIETGGLSKLPLITVVWDDDGHRDFYLEASLRVVVGEDAKPRHNWHVGSTGLDDDNIICQRCGVKQTDANYLGGCS